MTRPESWIPILVLLSTLGCSASAPPGGNDVPVRVDTVALDDHNAPVVILEEEGGPRVLPIWIGTAEATSIATEINDHRPPRPNFHDLAKNVIQSLDGEVVRVVVTELRQGTYYAVLSLRASGRTVEVDVRPSDGIALALRAQAPILVRASLFESAGGILSIDGDTGEAI